MAMATIAIKERSLQLNAAMVLATLRSDKTQSRRPMNPQPWKLKGQLKWMWAPANAKTDGGRTDPSIKWRDKHHVYCPHCDFFIQRCPYGKPGDHLRISEECEVKAVSSDAFQVLYYADNSIVERYGEPELIAKIRAYKTPRLRGVHLPPAYARPWRGVIEWVKVERLREISPGDAYAEGVQEYARKHKLTGYWTTAFARLYDEIYGKDSWKRNPWNWAFAWKELTT